MRDGLGWVLQTGLAPPRRTILVFIQMLILRHFRKTLFECQTANNFKTRRLTEHSDVTFLCTDPGHGGRGAASKLLRDVQDQAAGQNMAIVLESTMDAVAFYEKLGFGISQSLEMMLPPRGSTEPTDLYEEKCMVWRKL